MTPGVMEGCNTLKHEAPMFPDRLTQGYRTFVEGRFARERSRYAMLAEAGQRPEIMVVGCVDSRVSPEVIFDAAPRGIQPL